jgi:hypothetical protein
MSLMPATLSLSEATKVDLFRGPSRCARPIDIVFDGLPGPKAGRFVEVEDEPGRSVSAGEWVERQDGYWALRIRIPVAVLE